MAPQTAEAGLRTCEAALIRRLREFAVPFGEVSLQLVCEFQNGVPVMFRVREQMALREEKLR